LSRTFFYLVHFDFLATRNGGGAFSWHYLFGNKKRGKAMKTILSALAVVMLLGAATATTANAACWDTPWGVRCSHWEGGWHHHYWHPWHHDW
jgi:hypothetical protein